MVFRAEKYLGKHPVDGCLHLTINRPGISSMKCFACGSTASRCPSHHPDTGLLTGLTQCIAPAFLLFEASRCRSVHVTAECWWHTATSSCDRSKCDFPEKSHPSEALDLPYLTTKVLILSDSNVFYVVAPR